MHKTLVTDLFNFDVVLISSEFWILECKGLFKYPVIIFGERGEGGFVINHKDHKKGGGFGTLAFDDKQF